MRSSMRLSMETKVSMDIASQFQSPTPSWLNRWGHTLQETPQMFFKHFARFQIAYTRIRMSGRVHELRRHLHSHHWHHWHPCKAKLTHMFLCVDRKCWSNISSHGNIVTFMLSSALALTIWKYIPPGLACFWCAHTALLWVSSLLWFEFVCSFQRTISSRRSIICGKASRDTQVNSSKNYFRHFEPSK